MQKLPQMARRLEESLFRSALSFDEYRDTQTLKKRLQALAIAMGLRAQQQKQKTDEGAVNACPGSNITPDVSSHQGQNADNGIVHGSTIGNNVIVHGIAEGSTGRINTIAAINANAAVPEE
jgi:hypothetical protein